MIDAIKIISSGSSPRMRGAQFSETADLEFDRIIPAYAGSTGGGVS